MFGENGQVAHTSGLYMPALHVPLVMVMPGVLPEGERVAEPVTLRDLPATILDLVGAAGASGIPGQSLVGHARGGQPVAATSPLLSELDWYDWSPEWTPIHRGDMTSLVEGRLHYIRNGDGEDELYDAVADAAEATDLSAEPSMRRDLDRLRAALDSVLDRVGGERAAH
jgi:arylsulfatase A-like enzyme